MNAVPAPAEVSNAQSRTTWLRRAHLVRRLAFAAALLLLSYPLFAQKRRETILRLRDDVSTAMAHANMTQKQTQKLDRCRQTLLVAAQSGRMRKAASRKDLDAAVRDIEKALQNGPFQADDSNLVRQDIDQLRAIERNQRARRAGPPYKFRAER